VAESYFLKWKGNEAFEFCLKKVLTSF